MGIVAFWALLRTRALLLRARSHRRAALAPASPLRRARVAARPRPLARRGHRRRTGMVSGDARDRRRARDRAAARAPVALDADRALGEGRRRPRHRVDRAHPAEPACGRPGKPAPDERGAMTAPALTAEQLRARALATSRREAMRLRARRIRRAVAGVAVTLFATAFLIVYVQLASGHDPALVANAAKRRATVSASRSSAADASESTSQAKKLLAHRAKRAPRQVTPRAPAGNRSSGGESSSGASAVTTSQS